MPDTITRTRSLFATAGLIGIVALLSRLLGYARETVLAARLGASGLADAFIVAQELPLTLNVALVGALISVFIPVYRARVQSAGPEAGRRFTNTVLHAVVPAALLLVLLLMAIAPWIAGRLMPGSPVALQELAATLLRVTLPAFLFLAAGGVLSALLNANYRFLGPALMGLPQNLAVIIALLLLTGPDRLPLAASGLALGTAVGMLVQVPWLRGLDYRYQLVLDHKDPGLYKLGQMMLPVAFSFGVRQIQIFVDWMLASGLVEGSIAALNYANRVNALPYGVFGIAVTTVLFPVLAEHGASGKLEQLRATVNTGLRSVLFVLSPMMIGLWVFREPIVQLIFERGQFDAQATAMTVYALQFFAPGILFFGWLDLLNRTFYAIQDTVTPMLVAVASVALNVTLNLILVKPLLHGGLALGTTLATLAGTVALAVLLRRRLGPLGGTALAKALVIYLSASGLGALAGIWFYRAGLVWWGDGALVRAGLLVAGLGLVVVVHIGTAIGLKTPDGLDLMGRLGSAASRFRLRHRG